MEDDRKINRRRASILALAAVLTGTTLTGGFAALGLTRHVQTAGPPAVQVLPAASAPATSPSGDE